MPPGCERGPRAAPGGSPACRVAWTGHSRVLLGRDGACCSSLCSSQAGPGAQNTAPGGGEEGSLCNWFCSSSPPPPRREPPALPTRMLEVVVNCALLQACDTTVAPSSEETKAQGGSHLPQPAQARLTPARGTACRLRCLPQRPTLCPGASPMEQLALELGKTAHAPRTGTQERGTQWARLPPHCVSDMGQLSGATVPWPLAPRAPWVRSGCSWGPGGLGPVQTLP